MSGCAVYGCNNYYRRTKGKDIKYYRFPKNEDLVQQWVLSCNRKDAVNVKQGRICSAHFAKDAYRRNLRQELLNYKTVNCRELSEDAVPTLGLPVSEVIPTGSIDSDSDDYILSKDESPVETTKKVKKNVETKTRIVMFVCPKCAHARRAAAGRAGTSKVTVKRKSTRKIKIKTKTKTVRKANKMR